ncbi:MAG TPA: RNA methyltransferase [Pyrinomonadaceae bacterium]|jgi:TrmH family RNA methyltransferase
MPNTRITSRDNSLLRQFRAVREGKIENLIFVEGLRLCEEALRSGLSIDAVVYSEQLAEKEKAAGVVGEISSAAQRVGAVSEKLLESISYTKTPQGIVLLAQRPDSTKAVLNSVIRDSPLLIVMHRINNPVNVGAIIRTAEAAGASGAVATANTSDPFSPKSLRGAMGSAFRLPIWSGPTYEEAVRFCRERNIETVCADATGEKSFTELDWSTGRAVILGPESTGLSQSEIEAADVSVRIPMKGLVESLNVSVAAGILLYEAARQRARQ